MQTLTNYKEQIAFFMSKMPNLSKQTQEDINSGKKEFMLADFYIRKLISSAAGIVDFLKETDTLAPGLSNIDKGKLYQGQDMLLTSIGIAYGYHASVTTPETQDYSSNIYKINDIVADDVLTSLGVPVRYIPISIVNSEFTLINGGNTIYKSRTKKFFAENTSGLGIEGNDENNVLLPVPKVIHADRAIRMQFEFSANAAALSNKNFLEVRLQGLVLVDRGSK